jgi:hypothetical protein
VERKGEDVKGCGGVQKRKTKKKKTRDTVGHPKKGTEL